MIDQRYWLLILGCGFVTWFPRVLPFIFSRNITFSPRFRQFIPTLIVGYYTKDLMKIVITGIITIALIRLVG